MEPSGVLVCGAYGTGKSTAAEEIATRLEAGGVPFAAIDLDWLMWCDTGTGDGVGNLRLGGGHSLTIYAWDNDAGAATLRNGRMRRIDTCGYAGGGVWVIC